MEDILVREQNMASAIDDVNRGGKQREAAERWNVPQSTLCDRLHGRTPRAVVQERNRLLSSLQEDFLVD
jgi:hypothetical protein